MKKITSIILFSLIIVQALAQQVPLIKVGEDQLGVAKVDIQVSVIGNIATTTYDMYFYNPTSSVLEGELVFPLGEQQSVSRFALDVFGTLREAVVVEKEKGRVAFEAVVRRRVDPALLEKGTGNNYRARIYPIPANGYKRVLLAYEEPLRFTEGSHFLTVPQTFKNPLEAYRFSMSIENQTIKPHIRSRNSFSTSFSAENGNYVLDTRSENFLPRGDIRIEIPLGEDAKVTTYKEYAYLYQTLNTVRPLRKTPAKIQLYWDVSLSMKERNIEKELEFLDAYFKSYPNISVSLSTFSNTIDQQHKITIKNGDWTTLRRLLKNQRYDGATSFSAVVKHMQATDQVLLFSDGISTLSELPDSFSAPTFIINTTQKANHAKSATLAQKSDAAYLNLVDISSEEALEKLLYVPIQFLGFEGNEHLEFYPKSGTTVYNDLAVAIKGDVRGKTLHMKFGSNGVVNSSVDVTIPFSKNNSEQTARLWAQKKVAYLQTDSEKNEDDIVALGKTFNLVTDHTSLIVLESLRDYERYDIEPPKDLLAASIRSVSTQKREAGEITSQPLTDSENETEEILSAETKVAITPAVSGSNVIVSGTVVDPTGLPLPGVNIIVAGTAIGTQSDFDGNYSLNMKSGQDLVFSYVGFGTLETTVKGSGNVNINMQEAADALSEVVVTAQGIRKETKAIGYAISTVTQEELEQKSEGDVARALSGKASGVAVTSQGGTSGSATNVVIRGYNSITGNNQALFIVDGVPFSNDTNTSGSFIDGNVGSSRLLDLDPNNIENVRVLKGLAAATLYGTAGRNGVIIITTKTASSAVSPNFGHPSPPRVASNPNKVSGIDRSILKNERTVAEKGLYPSYIIPLIALTSAEAIYDKYLGMRHAYAESPAFYVDVYDYLKQYDAMLAKKVLSNIAEMDLDNYELLKVLAYKYEEQGNLILAAFVYRQVLKLRPEDAQSYRDLALVLTDLGQIEEATSLLQPLVDESLYEGTRRRNFEGMQEISTTELKRIRKNEKDVEADIRVVVDWNHNDTDIDLQIIDPKFEKCWYRHPSTSSNGILSDDMTEGFGPEAFVQKKARKGSYFVKVNYFDDRYQKIENPTFMKVTIYRDYGRVNESKEIRVVRLSNSDKMQLIERIKV